MGSFLHPGSQRQVDPNDSRLDLLPHFLIDLLLQKLWQTLHLLGVVHDPDLVDIHNLVHLPVPFSISSFHAWGSLRHHLLVARLQVVQVVSPRPGGAPLSVFGRSPAFGLPCPFASSLHSLAKLWACTFSGGLQKARTSPGPRAT